MSIEALPKWRFLRQLFGVLSMFGVPQDFEVNDSICLEISDKFISLSMWELQRFITQ